ncbi:MAG: hypothetical protein PHU85_20320 [Phycisphaerae bacterium]|nr:hypothetical protein [Phycisphaerae bacterium]
MATVQKCQACGASVYPEHIDEGRAGRWGGQMLCPICYAEKRGLKPAEPAPQAAPVATAAPSEQPTGDEPISLVDASGEAGESKIQAMGATRITRQRTKFKRPTTVTGHGATRVRTFHAKIQAEPIEFMDTAINDWLDENPDIEVKFVTSSIGTMAGKFPEPNIILNIWY